MNLHPHLIQKVESVSDGMGGTLPDGTTDVSVVYGILDLLSGTDRNGTENALTEESTHVLVTLDYTEGITDSMRVVDREGRIYDITYADDPAGQHHHNELLLTLKPGQSYDWEVANG